MDRRVRFLAYVANSPTLQWIEEAGCSLPEALRLVALEMFKEDRKGSEVELVRQMLIDLGRDGEVH